MTQIIQTPSLPVLSPATLAFAAEQGVTPYLVPVLELTRGIFPHGPITVFVDEDPEIANDRHIIINVDTRGFDAEQLYEWHDRWLHEIFDHCPATHVCVFRLATMDSP